MVVGTCELIFQLPENRSLKGKRQVSRSIAQRIRNRFNVSVAEVADLDRWQTLAIGVTCASNDSRHANEIMSKIVDFAEDNNGGAVLAGHRIEVLRNVNLAVGSDALGGIDEGPIAAALAALARDDPGGVVAALDGQLHHGRPGSPAALRQQVGERLATALAEQSGRINRWIDALVNAPSPTGRQVACLLLASHYPKDRAGVLRSAELLADDPHWEVREAAGGLLGTLLDRDYAQVRPRLEVLRGAKSENLRRAVVLAVKYAARRDEPERIPDLLDLLGPLLHTQEAYVRRNLGPYTIGDALLRANPKETLRALRDWSRDRDPMVRWNVAMAFSSAIGSFHWPAAKSILERLAKGPEPLVRSAVAKAMRRCRQRYTDEVEATRLRWLRDEERAATADLVGPLKKR